MQATRTYQRIGISKQLLAVLIALLAAMLIASGYLVGRATQTAAPAAVPTVVSGSNAPQTGSVTPGKYREPVSGRTGPQLAP